MALVTRTIPQLSTAAAPDDADIIVVGRPDGPARGVSYAAMKSALAAAGVGGEAADVAIVARNLAQQYAADAAQVSGVNVPIYASVASAQVATIAAGVKAIQTQFRAPVYADRETLVGGAGYARISLASIVPGTPVEAYFRSADRFMPDGTTDATNGGYWLIDESGLSPEKFGAIPNSATIDNTAAIHAGLAFAKLVNQPLELENNFYLCNLVITGINVTITMRGNGRAAFNTECLKPFDLTKPTVTIGDDVTLTRNCVFNNLNVSGTRLGGNYADILDQAPAAVKIRGNVALCTFNNPNFYNGIVTLDMLPGNLKPVTGLKFFGGELRNDNILSPLARTIRADYPNADAYYTDNIFYGTKINGPTNGYVVEFIGGALFEANGTYLDMPGALANSKGCLFRTGGGGLFHGVTLDPLALGQIIIETDDVTRDLSRVVQGDFRHGGQKWKNGLAEIRNIPDQANNYMFKPSLRDPWLNGAIYFGISTNYWAQTISLIQRTDVGPFDLSGADWSVRNMTQAVDTASAALQTEGGIACKKDLRVGGSVLVYGANAIAGMSLSSSTSLGGGYIESLQPAEDIQIAPGTSAYLRLRQGLGIRPHTDNAAALGITGSAFSYLTAYEVRRGDGTVVVNTSGHVVLRSYTVATLPIAGAAGGQIYVTNEVGGATPAFSDGTNWRRVADLAIVS